MNTLSNPEDIEGERVRIFTGPDLKDCGVFTVRKTLFGWGAESDDRSEMLDLSLTENTHYKVLP